MVQPHYVGGGCQACRETGVAESVTEQKRGEEHAFLAAVCDSQPMQYVHQYLARKVKSHIFRDAGQGSCQSLHATS